MGLPSTVSLAYPNSARSNIDRNIITANDPQYWASEYPSWIPRIFVEKYAVIRLTGRNNIVTLAKRSVILVSFSMACVSFRAMRLKFCDQSQHLCLGKGDEELPGM